MSYSSGKPRSGWLKSRQAPARRPVEGSLLGLPGRRPDFCSFKWPLGKERNQQVIKPEGQKHSRKPGPQPGSTDVWESRFGYRERSGRQEEGAESPPLRGVLAKVKGGHAKGGAESQVGVHLPSWVRTW
uniref:Uncharacterized protein n=1 Tax=Molossus molossus TaxID=27622 RepID=A0A7J8JW30_MOLMO|nr:hypothetical protein HJG59_008093 [Molossus molossus]